MAELGRNIFWFLITEISMIILAIVLKDDKRKVVAVLAIGTIFAGFIGFGQPVYLLIKEIALSLPNVSFPTRQPTTELELQAKVAEKINTIYSFKTRGTVEATTTEGKILKTQVETEYVRPDKSHYIEKSDDGQSYESINVGDQSCTRQGQGEWYCGDGFISAEIDRWIEMVRGRHPLA